jgi:hypothetical protein
VRTHCSDIAFSWLRCWKCGGATIRVRIPVCICIVEGRRRRYAVQAVQHGDVEQRLSTPSGLRLLGASGERAESGGAEGLFLSHSRIRACVPVISRVESRGLRGLRRKIEYYTARASLRDRLGRGRIVTSHKFPPDGFGDLSHLVGVGLCRVRGVGQE